MKQSFLDHLRFERRYSAHTLTSYELDLGQFREFLDGFDESCALEEAQTMHIRNWLVELMDEDYAASTVQRKLSTLKSFYRYLRTQAYRIDNPVSAITAPRSGKRLPTFADASSMEGLFDTEGLFSSDFSGVRDRVMILLFYATGMRLSELMGLQRADVAQDMQSLRVIGKRDKERVIPLSKSVQMALAQYQKLVQAEFPSATHLILKNDGEKTYSKFVYRKVNEYLGRVSTLSKRSPHVLRHTFATHMLDNGAELQSIKEILGHASLAATQVYTHNSIDRLKKIHDQAHPRG